MFREVNSPQYTFARGALIDLHNLKFDSKLRFNCGEFEVFLKSPAFVFMPKRGEDKGSLDAHWLKWHCSPASLVSNQE
jgi:hypothetical protein